MSNSNKSFNSKYDATPKYEEIKKSKAGAGLCFLFMNFENRLVKYIMEKQGLAEMFDDKGIQDAVEGKAQNCAFL